MGSMTGAQLRKLALSLERVEERAHFGKPDFRVNGKIFASLSQDEASASVKLSADTQEVVTSSDPDTYAPAAGAWGRSGWTTVRLAGTTVAKMKALMSEGHGLVGHKRPARKR
jgi:predicted DNA-binding protein (MmcQ/YjbR family)